MKRKLLALILSASLVVTLAACGSEEASGEAVNSECSGDVSDESEINTDADETSGNSKDKDANDSKESDESTDGSTDGTASAGGEAKAPEAEVHEHAYVEELVSSPTCTSVGLKKFTCECGEFYEEGIDMVAHDLGEFVYNNDATYEKDGTESASCKVCGNVIETRTKEGTMLVKAPEPVVVPSGLDTTIGDGYTFSGTTTSHNGVTLKTLNKFNEAGLYNRPEEYSSNFGWFGYITNDINRDEGKNESTAGTNMYNIEQAVGCTQGFTIWNDTIYFYFGTGGAAGAVELRRYPSKGYYTLSINYDITKGVGTAVTVEDGRDVVLAFCSMISSNPKELEAQLWEDMAGTIWTSDTQWIQVGDCDVRFGGYSTTSSLDYQIRPHQ